MKDTQYTSSIGIEYIVPKNAKSKLAAGEKKDCVVRAISSATGMEYDKAHAWCKDVLHRKNRKGTQGFEYKMNSLDKLFGKKITKVERNKLPKTTQGIIRTMNEGTYLISVSGHAFTIMNGVVIGNSSDARKGRVRIIAMWLVGDEPLEDYEAKTINEPLKECKFCLCDKPHDEYYQGKAYSRYADGMPPACKACYLKRNEKNIRRRGEK